MPVRKRVSHVQTAHIDPFEFIAGGGYGKAFFPGDPIFATVDEAQKAWDTEYRAMAWAGTSRLRLPAAAIEFDELTRSGFETFWSAYGDCGWPTSGHDPGCARCQKTLARILAAVADDRAAVATFRRRDPRGARQIDRYLDLWLGDLDTIERCARTGAAKGFGPNAGAVYLDLSVTKFNYGDAR